jgi:glycosyltransferase involved in cell wall biosynthesis
MITAILPTLNAERIIVPTLAALVPGAADGLLRQVIVADGGSSDATLAIADQSGCDTVTSTEGRAALMQAAVATARGVWLMFLEPGTILEEGWLRETKAFIEQTEQRGLAADRAAVFRPARDRFTGAPTLVELIGAFGENLRRLPRPSQGLLVSRRLYAAAGGHPQGKADPSRALLKRIGRRQIVRLRTGILLPD